MTFPKRAIFFLPIFCCFALTAHAQRQTREEYIDRYKSIAVDHMERYGIPASITLAQGILESDCGNSYLSRHSNNHFGIKCKRDWRGEKIYYTDDAPDECFRVYPNVEASYADHAEFLDSQPRYESLFSYKTTDYRSWATGLKAAGYATAPDYAERLIRIIEENQLFLLDRRNGLRLYAARHANGNAEWFAEQSNVELAIPAGRVDPDNYRISVTNRGGYEVFRTNGVCYVLAREGDTYAHIAGAVGVATRNLQRFNDVGKNAIPCTGEVVFIQRKKKRWEGDTLTHTAGKGETLYSLGQSYAIRMRSLAKMNRLPKTGAELTEGQRIKIR